MAAGLITEVRSVLDDTLHDEGGAESLDAGEGGEAVVVELLVGGQVGGDDAQKVVGFAEEPLSFPDVGMAATVCSNASTVARSPPRIVTKTRASKVRPRALASRCVVAADRAGVFQGAQPAVARGRGSSPTLAASSVTVRRPSCWSSARFDLSVTSDSPSIASRFRKSWKHIHRFPLIFLASWPSAKVGQGQGDGHGGRTVAAFWAVSFSFVITPGADWAYAIAAGLRHRWCAAGGGWAAGWASDGDRGRGGRGGRAGGPVAAGLDRADGGRRDVSGVAGNWHARSPGHAARPAEEPAGSWLRQAAKGAGISGLNPKVFLLFLALLPQFTDPDAAADRRADRGAGLVHVASCAVVYTGVGTGARLVLRARPTAARAVTRFSGTAMIVIGVVLLAEQLIG